MFDKAIEDASRCIQINYRQNEGYYRLALALNSVDQYDQALRTLYRGQEIDSRHAGIRRFIQQVQICCLRRENFRSQLLTLMHCHV